MLHGPMPWRDTPGRELIHLVRVACVWAIMALLTERPGDEQLGVGAGVTLLGAPSLKAALDIDWGDPAAQADALARLLASSPRPISPISAR